MEKFRYQSEKGIDARKKKTKQKQTNTHGPLFYCCFSDMVKCRTWSGWLEKSFKWNAHSQLPFNFSQKRDTHTHNNQNGMDGHWPFISLRYLFISPSEQMFLGRDLTAHSSLRQRIAKKVRIYLSFLFCHRNCSESREEIFTFLSPLNHHHPTSLKCFSFFFRFSFVLFFLFF